MAKVKIDPSRLAHVENNASIATAAARRAGEAVNVLIRELTACREKLAGMNRTGTINLDPNGRREQGERRQDLERRIATLTANIAEAEAAREAANERQQAALRLRDSCAALVQEEAR